MQPLLALDPTPLPSYVTGVLEVNEKAIVQNYRTLRSMLSHGECTAVLKADAYGFGAKEVASLLRREGCQTFFVAHIEEGLLLRSLIKDAAIYILSGLLPDATSLFVEYSLIPVLNDFSMVKTWTREAEKKGKKLPCALHFDTGMRRSGFDHVGLTKLLNSLGLLGPLDVRLIMSHLVSSHDKSDLLNQSQKVLFDNIRSYFPRIKASLADTGGIFLGPDYHYDVTRPGKGLFGLYAPPKEAPPLKSCLKVLGRILQVRSALKGETVGYGATHTLTRKSKLATIGIGFADGYDRRFSNNGYMEIGGFRAPVVGRISMDYTVIDVTDIPESLCYSGGWAELVNETLTLDILAHSIGTISRELSTGFGKRLIRIYT